MSTRRVGDPLRAVAYIRVSTEEQQNGPAAQRDAIAAWALRAGVRIEAWSEDRLSGGTPPEDRPGLLDALDALRASGCGLLVAAKRDRLARDVVVAATIERLVQASGARVVTSDGVSAEDTPEGSLMRTLLDAFAAYERAVIRARTRGALRAIAARGRRHTRHAPYGWRWEGGTRVMDAREQGLVGTLRDLRLAGYSFVRLAREMNARGEPCRSGRWHATQVRRILQRSPGEAKPEA